MAHVISLNAVRYGLFAGRSMAASVKLGTDIANEMISDGEIGVPAPVKSEEPVVAYCNPDNVQTGEKYTRSRDLAEVAKDVRKDIASAVKAGTLPKAKYSVRISRYSMGQSLTVNITNVEGMEVANLKRAHRDVTEPYKYHDEVLGLYSDEFSEVVKTVEGLVNAYNRRNVDSQSDYYDVSFYESVNYQGDALQVAREAVRAEVARKQEAK